MRLKVFLLTLLIPLALADEAVGGGQFLYLCRTYGIESADLSLAEGRSVKMNFRSQKYQGFSSLIIREDFVELRDALDEKVLAKYRDYYANGGLITQLSPITMGLNRPILFAGNGCGAKRQSDILSIHKIQLVN